jgi:O-antigen/teichoic acid export membrane protein
MERSVTSENAIVDPQGEDPSAAEGDKSIAAKVGFGLKWSLLGVMVTKMASFVISLAMARLLTPQDFGVFAIAMAVTAFLMHVNDVGIIAAVVQWPGRIEEMAATAAAMAVATSVAIYGLVFAAAPVIADAASTPDATWVIRTLGAVILVDGITAVRAGAIMRRFQQDKLTIANVIGFVVQAPLSIILAVSGAGAYSFAIAQVVGVAITGVFVFRFAKVPVEVGFDRTVARKLWRFGIPLAVSLGIEAILLNADYVIVGHLLGTTMLGYYLLAFNVSSWVPGLITGAVRYVSVPGFSRLAEENDASLTRGVHRTAPLLIGLILPFAVLFGILAPQIIAVLYPSKWADAAAPLRFLMILMACRVLISFIFDILTSAGVTRSTLWLNAVWAVFLIPALYYGTSHGGIRGTAMSHAIVGLVIALPLAIWLLEKAGVSLHGMLSRLKRIFFAAALCAAVCLGLVALLDAGPWVETFVAGGAGALVYLLVAVPADARRAVWARFRRAPNARYAAQHAAPVTHG